MFVMPKIEISNELAAQVDKQPESKIGLSRKRTGSLLLVEAIESRLAAKRASMKRGPKLSQP